MAEKIARRGIKIYIDGAEVENKVKNIASEMRKLTNEQAKMTIGSDEYIQHAKKIAQLKAAYQDHVKNQKAIEREWGMMSDAADEYNEKKEKALSMSNLANGFNKYIGMAGAFFASMTGLTFAVRKAVDQFAELEETEANVRKYTGMAIEEIKELGEEFKKWDTRTARTELNALAADAGRLGLKGKQSLLDFAEAGNIINVSLGEDLGEGAIKSIGKLSQMFGDAERMGLKEAMLSIGSAINEVAQNSSAAEPYLVNFTNRLAGVGNQAGLSVAQIIGLGSVLDQNAQQVEMSSTALSKLIMNIYKDPAKFANIAGLEVKKFTELLRNDANEALLTLLDTLNKKGGLTELASIFKDMHLDGARAASVLAVLAGNIELVRKEQETATKAFNDGTSVINEYNVKNNTLQASIEKAKKRFQELVYELGEKLAPHMSKFISTGGNVVKIISSITDFLIKNGKHILVVTSAVVAYTTALKALAIIEGAKNAQKGIALLVQQTKEWYAMGRALGFATANQMAFNAAKLMDPKVLATTLIVGLTTAIVTYVGKSREAISTTKALSDAKKNLNPELAKEQSYVNDLFNAYKRTNPETDEHRRIRDKIIEKYGPYLKGLIDEKGEITDIGKALEIVNDKLRQQIALKIRNAATEDILEKSLKNQTSIVDNMMKKIEKQLPGKETANVIRKRLNEIISQFDGTELSDRLNLGEKIGNVLRDEFGINTNKGVIGTINLQIGKLALEATKGNKALKDVRAQYEGLIDEMTELNNLSGANNTDSPTTPTSPTSGDDDSIKEKIKVIEKQAAIRRIAAMQAYQDQKSFEEELLKIERDAIEAKMALYKKGSKEYIDYQEELAKFDLKATQEKEKETLKAEKDRQEKIKALIEKYNKQAAVTDEQKKQQELNYLDSLFSEELRMTEEYLKLKQAIEDKYDPVRKGNLESANQLVSDNPSATNKRKDLKSQLNDDKLSSKEKSSLIDSSKSAELAQLNALKSLHDAEIDSIIDYEEMRLNIEKKYADLRETNNDEEFKRKVQLAQFSIDQMSTLLSAYSSYVQASQQAETAAIERKYDKQIKAAGKNAKKVEKLEKEKEEELAKVNAEYEDKSFKIQVAQAIASTAMAAINAYSSAAAIPVVGTVLAPIAAGVAVAAGMIQVAAIKKQHDAAKSNYYTGGFTPSGNWDQPQGVVHSNEFIANRFATGNPMLRPVFDVIDYAQRNNTIGSLGKKDIARALGMKGFSQGGYVNQTVVNNNTAALDVSHIESLLQVIDRLDKKLDEPFIGEVSITGRRGIKENMELYEQMISNASR